MAFSTKAVISAVLSIISVSLENVIDNLDQFSDLVEQLWNHSWLLSSEERRFNSSLIRFRAELKSTLPLIKEVEDELAEKQQELRVLVEKRMEHYENSLNNVVALCVAQIKQNLLNMGTTADIPDIEEQKKETMHNIQQKMVAALEEKRSLDACKMNLKRALNRIADLRSQLEVLEGFKESIRLWWVQSVEDGNRL
jgi:DNA repair exonuclease SbcCD ATPase subunit